MLKVILQKLMLCMSCKTYGSLAVTISFLLFFIMIPLNEFSSFFPLTAAALALVFILRFRVPQSPQKTKKFHPTLLNPDRFSITTGSMTLWLNFYANIKRSEWLVSLEMRFSPLILQLSNTSSKLTFLTTAR